jgi:hypothetical protein
VQKRCSLAKPKGWQEFESQSHWNRLSAECRPGPQSTVCPDQSWPSPRERVLALSEIEVEVQLDRLRAGLSARHADLDRSWLRQCDKMQAHLPNRASLSENRRLVLGAYFTREYAMNPRPYDSGTRRSGEGRGRSQSGDRSGTGQILGFWQKGCRTIDREQAVLTGP